MDLVQSQTQSYSDESLCRLAASGDPLAETELVGRYTRLVRVCARPLFLAGGDSEDLIQEGMLGLLAAIRGFQSGKETSFRTYAEICVRSRLYAAVRAAHGDAHGLGPAHHHAFQHGRSADVCLEELVRMPLAALRHEIQRMADRRGQHADNGSDGWHRVPFVRVWQQHHYTAWSLTAPGVPKRWKQNGTSARGPGPMT